MRLFVALDPPGAVHQELAGLIAKLKPHSLGSRWVRPEAMHVTLKFVGQVDDGKLPEIRAALASIRSNAPVDLQYRGIGFLPNSRRPRVLWCGIEASPNLPQLAAEIETALEPLGIARESRAFVPHLTLARLHSSGQQRLVSAAEGTDARDFGAARETNFHLYESILKRDGAEYKKLGTYSFVKDTRAT